ncbi:unnamed protein product [Cyprideis torosa]|uniref:Uncharacterized protein n=1 Tax=Cyprideis torosa TaxID=163714 RepID=A0A7R8WDV5_9CRUS|nr:unnamed protein product [Cyprideis torosa]CAG0895110.1 unnamed protein product [Cyprideis torosa]
MIDNNKDGYIDKCDLKRTFESLGFLPKDTELEGMMSEAPGPINFTMFLTLFGEKFASVADPEELVSAFKHWDEEGSGLMDEDKIRHDLMTWGDKFTSSECDLAFRDAPIYEKEGRTYVDYPCYVKIISGSEDAE